MSTKNPNINPDLNQIDDENEGPGMSEVFARTLKHWQWLLISVIFFTGLGVLLILRTPKSYTEDAQVVIKNDGEGGSSSADFNNLGIFGHNANVTNELTTMASPDIMEEVVKMLDLTVEYYQPGLFHDKTLYGNTLPFTVSFTGVPDDKSLSFKLDIDKNKKFTVSKLKYYDADSNKWIKSDKTYQGTFGIPVKTQYCTFTLNPTDKYQVGEDYEIIIKKKKLSSTVRDYAKKLKITLDDDLGSVLNLTISDASRQRADEILAGVIAVYNDKWIQEKNQMAVSTSKFIDDRLGVIEKELGNVDSDISRYKSENLIPDVTTVTSSYVQEQGDLSKMIVDLEGELQAAKGLRTRLTTAGNSGSVLPANTTIENSSLQNQIKDYNELVLKRNTLESKSSEKNPVVQQMDNEIAQLRGAILSSADNAIQGLEGQLSALQAAKNVTVGQIASSPTQAKYLLSVERQQKVKENLYLFLLQKREDNELNQAFTALNTRIIKKPGGDGVPTAPKKSLILLGSFVLGLLVPFGCNYVILNFDKKVRSRNDVLDLKVPMIGEIPMDKEALKRVKKGSEPQLVIENGNRNYINESFRVTRTNIEFTNVHKNGCNVIVFTSFNPGSGKSFVSMNLGAALALKGKRVLVIDGDMRRGTTSEYVGNPSKGLANYLIGHIPDYESVIAQAPGTDNLWVMPVGKLPPNPTELIETPAFNKMIESLREQYDYILIDCPPIAIVADADIMNVVADRTVFVLRIGLLDKALLKELEKFYVEKKYKHLSFILNGTDNAKIAYGNSKDYLK